MKTISALFSVMFIFMGADLAAQLPNGSPAPDFSLAIMSKVGPEEPAVDTFHLSEETAQGRGVCLFFGASWCSPCWTFRQDSILDSIYLMYGPGGTNDANVLFIEIDERTNKECLFNDPGCSFGTPRGNWTLLPYDLSDLDSTNGPDIDSVYMVEFFPTLYVVSPDMRVFEITDRSFEEYESWLLGSFKLTASGTTIDANCGNDGAVVLLVNGGHGLLSYEWSNGATTKDLVAINAGSYSVTITDENGYDIELGPFRVNGPAEPLGFDTLEIRNLTCNNVPEGVIDIIAKGGTSPYQYQWNTGDTTARISNLAAGSYTVTIIDAGQCRDSLTIDITQPPALILNYLASPERCKLSNGVIEAAGAGGTPPLSFSIGGPFSQQQIYRNLKAGIYTLEMRDSNLCLTSEQVLVDSILPPVANAGPDQFLGCNVDSVFLDGTASASGPVIRYQWTTRDGNIVSGDTTSMPLVNATGTYVYFVTNRNTLCVSVDTVLVLPDPSVIADAGSDTSLTCLVSSIRLDGSKSSQGPHTVYQWTTSGGNIINGQRTLMPLVDRPGTYKLLVTDTMLMCSDSSDVTVLDDRVDPVIRIDNPDTLTCQVMSVILDAGRSSSGPVFSYQWTTTDGNIVSGANTLMPEVNAPGTYQLRISNQRNGCESVGSVTVNQKDNTPVSEFSFVADVLTVRFKDESQGEPKTWLWDFGDGNFSTEQSPTHSYAQPAMYQVCLVITNECGQDEHCESFTLGTGSALILSESAIMDVTCFDGTDGAIDVTIAGGFPPYRYNWNNGSTAEDQADLAAGLYRLTVTDESNAMLSLQFEIDQPEEIGFQDLIITDASPGSSNGSVVFTAIGGVSPYRYSWSNGSMNPTLEQVPAGTYFCTVTDANQCVVELGPFEVKTTTTVNAPEGLKEFTAFPVPARDEVNVSMQSDRTIEGYLMLLDIQGKEIRRIQIQSSIWNSQIDLSGLAPGRYFLKLMEGNRFVLLNIAIQ